MSPGLEAAEDSLHALAEHLLCSQFCGGRGRWTNRKLASPEGALHADHILGPVLSPENKCSPFPSSGSEEFLPPSQPQGTQV